jgi:hypothetical protein
MFGEILPMMFKIMALEKELGKFFPNQNLRDMFTNVIFDRIKNQNSRNDLMKLARSFDISMFGITTDEITRIIDDINNSFLDNKKCLWRIMILIIVHQINFCTSGF